MMWRCQQRMAWADYRRGTRDYPGGTRDPRRGPLSCIRSTRLRVGDRAGLSPGCSRGAFRQSISIRVGFASSFELLGRRFQTGWEYRGIGAACPGGGREGFADRAGHSLGSSRGAFGLSGRFLGVSGEWRACAERLGSWGRCIVVAALLHQADGLSCRNRIKAWKLEAALPLGSTMLWLKYFSMLAAVMAVSSGS